MNENLKYPDDRKKYPTEEVDPDNFFTDDDVKTMIEKLDTIEFTQEDYEKLYNCVHCGACETEKERIKLKEKFLEQGLTLEGLKDMKDVEAVVETASNFDDVTPEQLQRLIEDHLIQPTKKEEN